MGFGTRFGPGVLQEKRLQGAPFRRGIALAWILLFTQGLVEWLKLLERSMPWSTPYACNRRVV
jgi:hypothetical protein